MNAYVAYIADEAEALAQALELGAIDVSRVIDWADAAIAAVASPHGSLCEVATAGRLYPQDIAALLRAIPGPRNPRVVRGLLCRLLEAKLRADVGSAPTIAWSLERKWCADGYPDDELGNLSSWASNEFDLAAAGYVSTTAAAIVADMLEILARSSSSSSETAASWAGPWIPS